MFNIKARVAALLARLSSEVGEPEDLQTEPLLLSGYKHRKSGLPVSKSSFKQNQRKQRKASARKKAKK